MAITTAITCDRDIEGWHLALAESNLETGRK
jgi:hypothetical protein